MTALGYRLGTLDALIRLRDHGVDPEYIRGMAATASRTCRPTTCVRARDHGVDPDYVRGHARRSASAGWRRRAHQRARSRRRPGLRPRHAGLGYKLTIDDFTRTRDHGVDPEYVRGLASLGYAGSPSTRSSARATTASTPSTCAAWRSSATRASRSTH